MLATILGTVIGIARLSRNWLLAKLALVYVEAFRNMPLLLQLFLWWDLLRVSAPPPRQAWQPLPGVFVSGRGIVFPVPDTRRISGYCSRCGHRARWPHWPSARMGQAAPDGDRRRNSRPAGSALALIVGLPLAGFSRRRRAAGASIGRRCSGFNFAGGGALSPEFAALLLGLTIYTATFIAEIVRAGILAVSRGQSEAALALGLRPRADACGSSSCRRRCASSCRR